MSHWPSQFGWAKLLLHGKEVEILHQKIGGLVLFLFILTLAGCGNQFPELELSEPIDRGMSGSTGNIIIEEPRKEEIKEKLELNYSNAKDMIQKNFQLIDTVTGETNNTNERVEIYATNRFTLAEISEKLVSKFPPDKQSEVIDQKQILIYPDYFVTVKYSETQPDLLLIEVATEQFVRNHYSPNFFTGFFALWVLDEVLDVDDWGKKRQNNCLTRDCYGGYSSKKYRSGGMGSIRTPSANRGGGPSSGK